MTQPRILLALLAYPVIVVLVFDWLGPGSRWAVKNRSFFPPSDISEKEETRGRPLLLVKYALLLLILRSLVGGGVWQVVTNDSPRTQGLRLVALGLAGSILLLAVRHLISLLSPRAAQAANHRYFLRGSPVFWMAVFVLGGFVEELWRAICIAGFEKYEVNPFIANLLPAIAFGVAHVCGLPSRVSPGGVLAEMVIGLGLGGLFLFSGSLIPPYIASVTYFAVSYFGVLRSRSPFKTA
jgi:hypothetical protein